MIYLYRYYHVFLRSKKLLKAINQVFVDFPLISYLDIIIFLLIYDVDKSGNLLYLQFSGDMYYDKKRIFSLN